MVVNGNGKMPHKTTGSQLSWQVLRCTLRCTGTCSLRQYAAGYGAISSKIGSNCVLVADTTLHCTALLHSTGHRPATGLGNASVARTSEQGFEYAVQAVDEMLKLCRKHTMINQWMIVQCTRYWRFARRTVY